jgi:glycosyltransferase involved in cell wall biosynthesis
MNILMLHNSYQLHGGEDESFASEARMLADAGHHVETIHLKNENARGFAAVQVGIQSIWSQQAFNQVDRKLQERPFSVLHVQNFFPLISPSVYYAARKNGVAVVQSLRNYRLLCPSAILYRDGNICEDCLHKTFKYPGILHGCYRGSALASATVAAMTAVHSLKGTWRNAVDLYIALTEFSRQKFIEAGFPPERIVVKSNFVYPDPGPGDGNGGFALFVGRLTPEKGVKTLLSAWERINSPRALKIVGEGPLDKQAEAFCEGRPYVQWLGHKTAAETKELMGAASALVFPSEWYEPFGRVAIESFAKGTPVVASRLAGMTEIVQDGQTGLLCNAGDPEDLAAKLQWAFDHPAEMRAMRPKARAMYESRYTAEENCGALIRAYQLAQAAVPLAKQPRVSLTPSN